MNEQCPCPSPKVFHVTEIKPDKSIVSLDLCEDCMGKYASENLVKKDKQVEEVTPAQFVKSVFDLLNAFAKVAKITNEAIKVESKMPICPECGITAQEVQEGGRFGCPHCYEYLAPPMLMKHLHGSIQHTGKIPKRWKEEQEKKKQQKRKNIPLDFRIKGLEIKMDLAAQTEKYELAAKIKQALEQLHELEREMKHLRYAIHTAVLDKNEDRVSELKSRLAVTEEKFFEVEMSVSN